MKAILLFQHFEPANPVRKSELERCILHNLQIGFDKIMVWNDSVDPTFVGENVHNIEANRRLTYRDYIDVLDAEENYGSLIVLTNTDIMLDRNLLTISDVVRKNFFLCFSRYERRGAALELPDAPWCTHDVWAMISQPVHNSIKFQSLMPLGMPGCELRFAEIIFNMGYAVFNPCIDIKNVHLHSECPPHENKNRIYGAYLFTPPCRLSDVKPDSMTNNHMARPVYLTNFIDRPLKIG